MAEVARTNDCAGPERRDPDLVCDGVGEVAEDGLKDTNAYANKPPNIVLATNLRNITDGAPVDASPRMTLNTLPLAQSSSPGPDPGSLVLIMILVIILILILIPIPIPILLLILLLCLSSQSPVPSSQFPVLIFHLAAPSAQFSVLSFQLSPLSSSWRRMAIFICSSQREWQRADKYMAI